MGKFKFFLPRGLAIFLILFVSVFALDALEDPNWPMALFMHLIPSFVLVLILAVAWKKEQLGGILFISAGLIAAGLFHNSAEFFLISVPLMIVGVLFFVSIRPDLRG